MPTDRRVRATTVRDPHPPPGPTRVPRWAAPATMVTSAVGLAGSVYLSIEHFTASTTLACPETGVVNCQKVTTSEASTVFGVPMAIFGVLFFAAMLLAGLPSAWRSPSIALRRGRVALAAAGAASVIYLVYVELFVVDALCLWCTAVHAAALAGLGIISFATAEATS
jgi:uncharacterized membrane protein